MIGNEAGALGRGNGVGGRALGPVRARKNGRRGHDRRTVREARDPGQGHEIGRGARVQGHEIVIGGGGGLAASAGSLVGIVIGPKEILIDREEAEKMNG